MFINIENVRIYYEKLGEGAIILLIHGWGTDVNSLSPLAKKLSGNYTVYSLDLPGFGMSESLKEFDSYILAEVVEKFIERLNLKIFGLIGHSLGAKICSIIASKGIGEKLILIGSPGISYKKSIVLRLKTYFIKIVKFILTKILFIKEESNFFKLLRGKVGSNDYRNASEGMKKSFKRIISEDIRESFIKIKQDTLIFHGTEDKEVPLEVANKIKYFVKNSKLVIIEKADHYCYYHPIFLKETNKFLESKGE